VPQVLPSEYVPPVDAAPGAPGLPDGGGSGGKVLEISLLLVVR
jgi:hypothetical protein